MTNIWKPWKTMKGGGAGITEKRHVGGVTTDLLDVLTEKRHVGGVTTDLWDGGGGGAGITEKRDIRGDTTDLLDVLIKKTLLVLTVKRQQDECKSAHLFRVEVAASRFHCHPLLEFCDCLRMKQCDTSFTRKPSLLGHQFCCFNDIHHSPLENLVLLTFDLNYHSLLSIWAIF